MYVCMYVCVFVNVCVLQAQEIKIAVETHTLTHTSSISLVDIYRFAAMLSLWCLPARV
jgi:hypothetical protein